MTDMKNAFDIRELSNNVTEKKQPPNRKKKNRLIVRVNDELNNRIRDLMAEMKFYTVQDFLEAALLAMVEQNEDQDKDGWEKFR